MKILNVYDSAATVQQAAQQFSVDQVSILLLGLLLGLVIMALGQAISFVIIFIDNNKTSNPFSKFTNLWSKK